MVNGLDGATSLVSLLPGRLQYKFPIKEAAVVNKLFPGLNFSKTVGPDAIRPIVLKGLCQKIAPDVALIFQTSFDSGIKPTDWKKAQVCPIF